MNTYIQRTKDAILDYLSKAQQADRKIAEGRKIYNEQSMEQEEKRLRDELAKARKDTEARIDSIIREASADGWGRLDGSKLTADAQLLHGQGVTPDQFNQLVDRYKDNYTMLDALRKYGEARNAEAAKEAKENGKWDALFSQPYNVREIPGPDAKSKELDALRKRADYFLNVADGTGFSSEFERTFARSTADKSFEAWGEEPQETPRGTAEDFAAAWGFGPKEA